MRRAQKLIAAGALGLATVGLGGVVSQTEAPTRSAVNPRAAVPDQDDDDLQVASRERWRLELPGEMIGMPAVDADRIYVTAADRVVAVSHGGAVAWQAPFPGSRVLAPVLTDHLAVVAGDHGLVALSRVTGERVWSFETGPAHNDRVNGPAVVDDIVVASTVGGRVVGLDLATGALRWDTQMATSSGALVAGKSGVAVVVGIAEWVGIDAATGKKIWSGDLGLIGTSSPVVYELDGAAFAAVASDEKVIAVGLRDGQVRWHARSDQSELAQVPVVTATGSLLVPDHWGRMAAYDARTGQRLWSTVGAEAITEFGAPVPLGGRLVVLPLSEGGPRIASDKGAGALRPPATGFGAEALPGGGLVVSTWGKTQNYLLVYDLDFGGPPASS